MNARYGTVPRVSENHCTDHTRHEPAQPDYGSVTKLSSDARRVTARQRTHAPVYRFGRQGARLLL